MEDTYKRLAERFGEVCAEKDYPYSATHHSRQIKVLMQIMAEEIEKINHEIKEHSHGLLEGLNMWG